MEVTENGIHLLEDIEPVVGGRFEATATEELNPPRAAWYLLGIDGSSRQSLARARAVGHKASMAMRTATRAQTDPRPPMCPPPSYRRQIPAQPPRVHIYDILL